MGLELYLDLLSQPCRAIYIFAKKNGIPFELRAVDLVKGEHLSDAFTQVNPVQKVPALKDGDFTLTESVAILLYLTRKRHWAPPDRQACARVDEYLSWQHTALRRNCLRALWHKVRQRDGEIGVGGDHDGVSCSVAILLYLTRKYKVPDHWYPRDLQACARVDEYLSWQHTALRRNCLRALWHKIPVKPI
ncbi:Glutathione S-transferase theta-1 [Tupaia chinensis]|uniref:glutathione transferase n=1 Tax=Tupaia chinensis TaxID=246437 RepID=L9LC20_TUPCH|nr:Glutathione S-transferase theta-1 [Tupaia chinensis]